MLLKVGSKGKEVKSLQEYLGLYSDGDFGPNTEKSVKEWQLKNGLSADGIVGPMSWRKLNFNPEELFADTDIATSASWIKQYPLPDGEYVKQETHKEWIFLHHTAGWNNPYKTINNWGRDTRGAVATEFVLGGQSVKGNDDKHDGVMVQAFPEGCYGWHLGKNGSQHMHTHSVGVEVNNFGYIKDGKTYAGTKVHESQIVTLDKPFRGYTTWHRYSDKQIEAIRLWLLWIGERDGIDIQKGLISEYKKNGLDSFEWNSDAYYGRIKGMWTHTNTKKGKSDMSPQPKLIEMLLSL